MEDCRELTLAELEKRLTDRQKLFVAEYMRDLNGTKAAVRAGYAEKNAASTASRLLRRPEVAEYRNRKIKESFDALGITPEFLQMSCFEIYKRCMQKEPVLIWKNGGWQPSGDWQFDARGALKAIGQMAKLLRPEDDGEAAAGFEDSLDGGSREF